MKSKIVASLLVCCFVISASHAQGKLNRAKNDLSGTSSSSSSNSNSNRSTNNNDDDWGDGVGFFDGVFIEIAYHATIGIFFGEMESRYFYEYPYSDGSHGEYAYGDEDESIPLKRSQFIVSNTFFTSGKEFYGNDIKLNFRFVPLVGIEANHLHFFEDRPKNNLGATSVMINYYRVREQYVTAFWGVGATHVGNGVDETGFAYQVGVEVFLKKPYSLSALWKQSLINDSSIDEFKLHARYHLKRLSIHGGYNHYQLGSVSINALGFGVDYRF
ncbi:hypothetical protein KORDIASMS9_00188 [Kordia sp. SMS9]|uniref:hypothetical protein n=1 Tax=Kordia sp. SMS9 TaxID=2282170 RepID=UPI000E0DD06C|nr:hypothetical protein [Kordia sp. SMS9]AXG68004.1 hypothetical protein KORDIASMS9_00188 [Kordia sp. SMS9]